MNKFRILSIDGGGSKGAVTLGFLKEIEKRIGKPIHSSFDLFVGTSAGSIIVGSLCLKDENGANKFKTCDEILDTFVNNVDKIFYKSWYHMCTTLNGLIGPKYDSSSEFTVLRGIFGDTKINSNTLITSNIIDPQIKYFEFNSTVDLPIVEAIMASSAAPTYYGVHSIFIDGVDGKKKIDFVDGGISANNPSLAGFAEATKRGYLPEDILLVSIGTGCLRKSDNDDCDNGGILQWAVPITSNMMTTTSDFADYQLKKILSPDNYYRLNVVIDSDKMDVIDKTKLYTMANNVPQQIAADEELATQFDKVCKILSS